MVACAAGVALTVAGVSVIHGSWGGFWAWALPGVIANEFSEGLLLVPELPLGSPGGLVAAMLAGWDVRRRVVL